jgi:hypothetical protein
MTVFSKKNYEDPDDGRILKAARKQQHIMFPAPIAFLNDELKAELGMKMKKEEKEMDDAKFCSLKVPLDHEDKDSKTYVVKVKTYDSGTPEEFLKWRLVLNEQTKTNGYAGKYDMIMNLAQAMLAGRSLEAFLMERRSQEAKHRILKANNQTEHTSNQIYYYAIFELAIRAFDIQSGWRDAYERQREYVRRDLFMGKHNPEKFSQQLQDLNRFLDFIPIEKTSDKDKIVKAYGKSLPEDEIRSIMGRAIPPEWTVNMLALGKEPWRFKDLEDQLNMYCWQWQADRQKQIIANMAGKMPGKKNEGKRKISDRNLQNSNGGRISTRQGNTSRRVRGGRGRGRGGRGGRGNNSEHLKMWNVSIVAKKATTLLTAQSQEKMTMNSQTWCPSRISKNLLQSSLKEMLTKKYKQAKKKLKAVMIL